MQYAQGLCSLQSAFGEKALSKVCREFPRLSHDYGHYMELGLELSCPEAARLMLTAPWGDAQLWKLPEVLSLIMIRTPWLCSFPPGKTPLRF